MNRLEDLPNITNRALSELKADLSMKNRILMKAKSNASPEKRIISVSPIPVLCSVMAVMILFVALLNKTPSVTNDNDPGNLVVFAAGNQADAYLPDQSSVTDCLPDLFSGIDSDTVLSMDIQNIGSITDKASCTQLFEILRKNSIPANEDGRQFKNTLLITTQTNTYILEIDEPYLKNIKCVSCPSFFKLFRDLVKP